MEIVDYLRIARRRLWVLILVPLLAAGGAVALVLQSPPTYSATGYLSSGALVGGANNQFTGTQAASQFAAAFTAAAGSPPVLSAVSRANNVPVSDLSSGLTVAQNGASSDMTLAFTSDNKQDVIPALTAIKNEALDSMFAEQVTLKKEQVVAAQAAVATQNQELSRLTEAYGSKDPRTTYQASLTRAAVAALRSAQIAYQAAQNQLSAAQSNKPWYLPNQVRTVSLTAALLRTAIPVVAAAIFLAVMLIAMMELLANSRRRSREARAPGQPGRPDRLRRTGRRPEVVPGE